MVNPPLTYAHFSLNWLFGIEWEADGNVPEQTLATHLGGGAVEGQPAGFAALLSRRGGREGAVPGVGIGLGSGSRRRLRLHLFG